ncbi:hypothetical protein [Streptomyces sp. G-G2]|uniref:hypothetical protein n=1 Tax=Streptomyces sp. G-G2 TaxID=3046201 RepID=UPI0024B96333|nr:hypothetical protein [Streptomyces sp. G-G2]MDJ0380331.1 hypothetical protein [Streptomyces sp. G-G2]
MQRSVRGRVLATLTVLAAAGALAGIATPALAAGTDTNVYIVGSNGVQYAGDDNFNAGRDNTVGSNDGTAPPAVALGTPRAAAIDWTTTF